MLLVPVLPVDPVVLPLVLLVVPLVLDEPMLPELELDDPLGFSALMISTLVSLNGVGAALLALLVPDVPVVPVVPDVLDVPDVPLGEYR